MNNKTELRAVKARLNPITYRLCVELNNDVVVEFPCKKLQGLENATPSQIARVQVTPSGYGLHWEELDVDLAVPQLVGGIFGTKAWMAKLDRQRSSSN